MARQPRYEDYVTYDPEPEEAEECERFDPHSGRPISEIAAFFRAKGLAELAALRAEKAA